jgi:hypothetical protein
MSCEASVRDIVIVIVIVIVTGEVCATGLSMELPERGVCE